MSQPGASGRHRQYRHTARPASRLRRPLLAVAVVLLVVAPICWILAHQPDPGDPDAAIQYVTRDDDRYVAAPVQPVDVTAPPATPQPPVATPSGSPSPTPDGSTSTPTPKSPATPGQTPTAGPTDRPTAGATDRPGDGPATTRPPGSRLTAAPTTGRPSTEPTPADPSTDVPDPEQTPPPDEPEPPADNGSMSAAERELFTMIDNARTQRGCAPLDPDSGLTGSARAEATWRAEDNELTGSEPPRTAAEGGRNWSASTAYHAMMEGKPGMLLNCGLDELGVGRHSTEYRECKTRLLVCVEYRTVERVSWVAKFR